jgi:hypothetical protein
LGDVRLAGRGDAAHDDDQRQARAPAQPLGRGDERRGVLAREVADLRADPGAVGAVEVHERIVVRIAACLTVRGEERAGEIARAACLELHDEERDVGGDVGAAQVRIEFDAVVGENVAVGQHHVLEAHIAVTVAHPPAGGAFLQLIAPAGEERVGEPCRRNHAAALGRRQLEVEQRLEVLVARSLHGTRPGRLVGRLRVAMEGRDPASDAANVLERQATGVEQRGHRAILGQARISTPHSTAPGVSAAASARPPSADTSARTPR